MARNKYHKIDTSDRRPLELRDGNSGIIIGRNIDCFQKEIGCSPGQMAELMMIGPGMLSRIKSGDRGLSYDAANLLYYGVGMDLNRVIANDRRYDFFRTNPEGFSIQKYFRAIIMDIEHTEDYDERTDKILYLKEELVRIEANMWGRKPSEGQSRLRKYAESLIRYI